MSQTIRFTSHKRYWDSDGSCRLAHPFPAKERLPEWYKRLPRHCPAQAGEFPERTVKMCPPFLAAMVHGYVIPAPFDFEIDFEPGDGTSHGIVQRLQEHVGPDQYEEWKPVLDYRLGAPLKPMVLYCRLFWRIETPAGFSCLCFEPLNRNDDELPFQVLSQLVETDKPQPELIFSLVPRGRFPIVVKQGTPLVQVLPIRREEWELKTTGLGDDAIDEIKVFRDAYWSCENRKFDEGADPTNPEQGYGAFHKLVKTQTRFQ